MGKKKEWSGVIWQMEGWQPEEALGELVNRISQQGGVKEGLIQTSFSCLIERLCNEGEIRDPDTEKVQEAEDRQEFPFCFWKWTVNQGLDSIWGYLLVGYGEPQVGDVCLYYLGCGLEHSITPGSQGPKEFGSMLEAVFGLGYKGGGHLRIGGDDSGLGRVSVGPFVKPVQKSGGCL